VARLRLEVEDGRGPKLGADDGEAGVVRERPAAAAGIREDEREGLGRQIGVGRRERPDDQPGRLVLGDDRVREADVRRRVVGVGDGDGEPSRCRSRGRPRTGGRFRRS
jgi:hypothetical protein